MMINKRLIGAVPESKKYIAGNVALQWCSLCANIAMMSAVTALLAALFAGEVTQSKIVTTAVIALAAVAVRYGCTVGASRMGYLSSKAVKKTLRGAIYDKLLCLGASYSEQVKTSEVVQVAVEGVDQLETYFGAYLPQFFYAMLAPLTLFVVLCFVSVPAAVVLLVCVPLIPVAIAAVQTWAKKLLSKYWGQYTALGDTFLENLQGLTTLKIYQADAFKNDEMNVEAEKFRKITMKVLTMQLNSITIMDLIAYGGAALGVIMAATQLRAGKIDLAGVLLIILLAADFFIPMRQLGSFFHIAMNGMAASDKIFRLLDLSEPAHGGVSCPTGDIVCRGLRFSYEPEREILHGVDLTIPQGKFVSLVGESDCGKSTISALLMGRNKGYTGSVAIGGAELRNIEKASLMRRITYVSHQSYLFKGTVRDNLLMGKPGASDDELWSALTQVNLADFLRGEAGRDRGDLISVITSDIELLEVFYAHTISPAAIAALFTLIMCLFIGHYHALLGLLALAAYVCVGVVIPLIASRRSGDTGMRFRTESGTLSAFVLDSLRGLNETIQYDQGAERRAEMDARTDALSKEEAKLKRLTGQNMGITNTAILLFDLAMLVSSAALVQRGELTFDGALIAVLALFSSFGPTVALANLGATLQNTFAAGNRVLDILDEEPVVDEVSGQKEVEFTGAEAEYVTFSYGREDILSDVSVRFPEGSVVGIVGRSGSGKSTLLKLLMRFWDVQKGRVRLSGTDVSSINTGNLREMESFVTQETHLFHDSIKNNLRIAKLAATDDEIVAACKKAAVHEFIMTLPQGYDTSVGELGDTLSGGERQRLGLARAFLHDAPLMLLDEPTSNLDSLNEAVILKSLHEQCAGKTVVLVSHRASTMRIADTVYSVEHGRMS